MYPASLLAVVERASSRNRDKSRSALPLAEPDGNRTYRIPRLSLTFRHCTATIGDPCGRADGGSRRSLIDGDPPAPEGHCAHDGCASAGFAAFSPVMPPCRTAPG